MQVPDTSPWVEHMDPLNELETEAKAAGMRVEVRDTFSYLDAELFEGERLVGIIHYNPEEEAWACEHHSRFFCPLDEIIQSFKDGNRQLAIYVSYKNGKLPEVSKETLETIRTLLPGKPDSVTVLPHEFS
jgi:hypothetical protein